MRLPSSAVFVQLTVLHMLDSIAFPGQVVPPSHVLILVLVPELQVTLQSSHGDHDDHTAIKSFRTVIPHLISNLSIMELIYIAFHVINMGFD